MPQDISKHTFEGGINKDLSKSKIKPNQYIDAKNITVSLNEENNLISLSNVKGNSKQWGMPYFTTSATTLSILDRSDDTSLQTILFADIEITKAQVDANGLDFRIVGYTIIRSTLVLLTRPKTDINGMSMIWTVDLDSPSTNPVLKYIGILNFPLSPIDVEGNYESSTVQKIYWADGTNELGHFNIADSDGYKLNAGQLFIIPDVTLPNFDITSVTNGGSLPYGIIQYAVDFYNINGAESSISDFSEKVYIYETSPSDQSIDVSDTTANVSKTINLSISDIDTTMEFIRVYRISYSTASETPTVEVIREEFNTSSTISIIDDGTVSLYTRTISELDRQRLLTKTIPNNLISKDNRLLLGNYNEDLYNPDYDTRAYRFYSSDDGNYTTDVEVEQLDTTLDSYTGYTDVPSTHDCINPDNDAQQFLIDGSTRSFRKGFASSTNTIYELGNGSEATSGIGGSGENISYYFVYQDRPVDNDTTSPINVDIDPEADDSPENLLNMEQLSFMRDEIYRFAIILIDNKGRRSLPRWIADIRIPSAYDFAPTYVNSNILYAREIYPTFILSNLPTDCVATQIMYVPRTDADKTVICQGIVFPTIKFDGPDSGGANYKCLGITELVTGTSPSTDSDNYATTYWFDDNLGGAATLSAVDADTYSREYCAFHSLDIMFKKNLTLPSGIYFSNEYIQGYNLITSTASETFYRHQHSTTYLTSAKQDSVISFSDTTNRIQTPDDYRILDSDNQVRYMNGETFKYIAGWSGKGAGDAVGGIIYPTMIFKKDSLARYRNPGYDDATYGTNHLLSIVNLKAPLLYQYGGQGYISRKNNYYIVGSDISTSSKIYANKGDTSIQADYLITARSTGVYVEDLNSTYIGGFESQIKRRQATYANRERQTFATILTASDFSGLDGDLSTAVAASVDYYVQNDLINRERINKYYPDLTLNSDVVNGEYDTSIKISEVKFPNESYDNWLRYLTNKYINISGKYGPINSLNEINDTIVFFQDDAIGQLSINPKYSTATSEGDLIVGTGGILDDYKYITTTHGCKNRESILKTPKGLYYFDKQNNKLRLLGDELSPLSDLSGVYSYLKTNTAGINTNPIQADGVTSGYDYSTNKAYFTFHTDTPFTIVFDESLNIVETFVDCNPLLWITTRQGLFSTMSEADYATSLKADDLYEFGTGSYGTFFGTAYSSYITFVENTNPDILKVFNNIEYFMEVTNSGVEETTNSFDYIRVWNNYQDTTELPLTQPNRLHIFERKWRLFIPRNYKSYAPTLLSDTASENDFTANEYVLHPTTFYLYKVKVNTSNYELPSNNSLDQSIFEKINTPLDRIKDFYSFIKLTFTNDGTDKFICHDILVKYDY